jgi:hypothetical protein
LTSKLPSTIIESPWKTIKTLLNPIEIHYTIRLNLHMKTPMDFSGFFILHLVASRKSLRPYTLQVFLDLGDVARKPIIICILIFIICLYTYMYMYIKHCKTIEIQICIHIYVYIYV